MFATVISNRVDCHSILIGGYAVRNFGARDAAEAAVERINLALSRGDKATAAAEMTDASSLRRFLLATR